MMEKTIFIDCDKAFKMLPQTSMVILEIKIFMGRKMRT